MTVFNRLGGLVSSKKARRWMAFAGVCVLGNLVMAPSYWEDNTPYAQSTPYTHWCYPNEVSVLENRVHVQCSVGGSFSGSNDPTNTAIRYFAIPNTQAVLSDRLLTLGSAAMAGGARLAITYIPAADGHAYGCLVSNCRPPLTFALVY